MKTLLDESVPQKLRLLMGGGHTVVTVWYQGWSGLKNGALLDAAEQAGFDLFVTANQRRQDASPWCGAGPPSEGRSIKLTIRFQQLWPSARR
jgi:hypothetical protein